ncbi:MAG: CHAT domain-containing protein [Trichodesmium sp.]
MFQTSGSGGIGLIDEPLRLDVENLEAVSGSGGVFFDVGNINIGDVSEDVDGIVTAGGDLNIKSEGDVTLTETMSTQEIVENNSEADISPPSPGGLGGIETVEATENTEVTNTNGAINIEATGDIIATGSGIKGGGESVSLSATNITINDQFDETSGDADVKLEATNDITVEDIEDDVLEFLPGSGEIEFRADVDGDGVGIVEMLDNEADVGSDPNTFENGADTIKTNGRNLTIAGAGISLGNIDTSWLPIYSREGEELLATIDVDEGGPIPEEGTEGTATFTFTVDGDLETIENLDIRFSAEHTWDGDLEVYLESPEGNEVMLFTGVGGSGQNFQDTVLDDDASTSIDSGNAPFDGTYSPQESLAEFNGENPNGTWTLRVTDTYPTADDGTLYRAGDDAEWGTTAIGTQLLLRTPLVEIIQSAGGRGNGNGGAINLEATHNNISVGNIRSLSETGDGGIIDLKANNNIITGFINSSSRQGIGGDVNLNSISGNINTFSLDTSSFDGDGGNVEIKAVGDITTADIITDAGENDDSGNAGNINIESTEDIITDAGEVILEYGYVEETNDDSGNAGNINIESTEGSIDTTAGSVSARSVSGDGGDITLSAGGNIQTSSLDSSSSGRGSGDIATSGNISVGNITQTAGGDATISNFAGGDISIGSLNLSSSGEGSGDAGDINISADGNIQTASISGQNITIESQSGRINTSAGSLNTNSSNQDGGNIEITADGNIRTASISGQNITIHSSSGNINTSLKDGDSSINAYSSNEDGGNIEITADGNIKTASVSGQNIIIESQSGRINTSEGSLSTSSYNQDGGNIEITADGNIQTSSLDSSSFGESGDGGNINITSNNGNITLTSGDTFTSTNIPTIINSSSENGTAGDFTINSEGLITVAGQVLATGNTQGGNINLTSKSSDVNSSLAIFNLTSENGTNGNLNITANNGSINMGELSGSRNITIADGGKSDGVSDRPNAKITLDADKINEKSGEVSLQAHNDITIDESINTEDISQLELRAGRDININADIDTSSSNGDISLSANDQGADLQYRGKGAGDITMAAGTTINAGSGEISISIGNLVEAEVGDITLSNLQTTGNLTVDANGGNIFRSSENSLITAGNGAFQTEGTGSIGTQTEPLNISLENLSARSGSGGVFFNSPNQGLNIGNASNVISGISTQDGGDIKVTAKGDITVTESLFTASIERSAANEQSGNITLESTEGSINTTATNLNSSSINGNAGDVELSASGDINTANISASSENGNGGNITIASENGSVDTTGGFISSYSNNATAGNVELSASGDIKTRDINTYSGNLQKKKNPTNDRKPNDGNGDQNPKIELEGNGQGGNVTITSKNGSVNTTEGWISTYANGEAGGITITASGNINTGYIDSYSDDGTGGDVTITSDNGSVDTTNSWISSYSFNGSAGDVDISASEDINTGTIDSSSYSSSYFDESEDVSNSSGEGNGGNITITSDNGSVNTTSGWSISSYSDNGKAGDVDISASGDINTGSIDSYSYEGQGGNINITSTGNITTNNIESYGGLQSGNISISSKSEINTANLTTQSEAGPSGNILVNSKNVATGNLQSLGRTAAGQIKVTANDGSIRTGNIESISTEGEAGGIDLNASEDIETGDQTVNTTEGDASINNEAGGDINTGDQTATTENGDAIIDNDAGRDINTGDQIATTENGDAIIDNDAGRDINTGDQTATTENGDAIIDNDAGRDINTGDQIATTENGDAIIDNDAGRDINTGEQIAIGDTTSITNQPGGNLNTGEIIEISPPPGLTVNTVPQPLPPTPVTPEPASNLVQPPVTVETASNLVQPPVTAETAPNLAQPPVTPAPAPNLVQPPVTPVPIPENIPPSNNSVLNSATTTTLQLVQSDSTITTTNNPNLPNQQSVEQEANLNTDTTTALGNINIINSTPLTVTANFQTLANIEQNRNNQFTNYFGSNISPQVTSIQNIREVLEDIARQTGNNSAIIYVTAYSEGLQLILYTPGGDPILKTIPDANRKELIKVVLKFRGEITNPSRRFTDSYLPPAQQLYDWLIRPLSAELTAANIDTLIFSMDEGLRSLPVAALHDGEQFLIEKYSLSLIPSISLMDTNYRPLQNTQILAMGASEFIEQSALPAVPIELETISQNLWQGSAFINENFTRNNLLTQRQNYPYPIIHLATHAEFQRGKANNSYIQLWGEEQLRLDEMRELGWNEPPVELLVLSACRTAFGDKNAELGFAGLAVAAGVKSALASLWYVSDEGTLALMTEFYTHLNHSEIKAEALRNAQLAMLRGEVVIQEGELRGSGTRGSVALPSALGKFTNQNLSHPYYWSGFTMIGSPW